MKKRIIAVTLSLALIFSVLVSLSGCGVSLQATNLMSGVKAKKVNTVADLTGDDSGVIANFAVKLFQNSSPAAKNTLVSPLSVLCALAMTANGAKGETLKQMENTIGLSAPQLNDYMHSYIKSLPSGGKYKLRIADSIWFKDDKSLTVEKDFLQTNADYYGASIYKTPFDEGTLNDINAWVSDKTGGMIKNILDKIPEVAVIYLVNALAFDAEWESIYKKNQVTDGTFTTEAGDKRQVKMMHGFVGRYLDDGKATGFIKYYADRKYAFVALLPNEDISVADYIKSLTGEGLMNTLKNTKNVEVDTAIPRFQSEYAIEMSGVLKSMGISDAFNADAADFTGLGRSDDGKNIYISRVLHKTYIAVDERGTKAGAVTTFEGGAAAAASFSVYLDRPFVYMLIDCKTNLPVFIGTTMDIGK